MDRARKRSQRNNVFSLTCSVLGAAVATGEVLPGLTQRDRGRFDDGEA